MNHYDIGKIKQLYPEKLVSLTTAFSHIHSGDRIFIGTGCGEPQYLVRALVDYVHANPNAFFDTEVLHTWAINLPCYTEAALQRHFRANSLFIGSHDRDAVNQAFADYTPVFLSRVPGLFQRRLLPIDVALVQTSWPDAHGYLSLGVSVDMTKEAVASAPLVVAQLNAQMPRVHGDAFIPIHEVSFLVPCDEPILESTAGVADPIAQRIGQYVARLIEDGDTLQVGYGSIPNAILAHLGQKKHLGVHTELLTDGLVELIRTGVIDNTQKSLDRGKTVATFCMGSRETYRFIHDNPAVEFHPIDYTNHPLVIARQARMAAINSLLEIDLTGQATAESISKAFFSGIGGSLDFIRSAPLAPHGKAILTLPSTTEESGCSRIVPFLREGAGVTLNRGDVYYVVTEYGIAYLHGKSIRERAMELIAIAHPNFRPWLIEEAKKANLIYKDQLFVPGKRGEYPEDLEAWRVTRTGLKIFLRPVKISDEPLFKALGHRLSDQTIYRRFFSRILDMPHELLQRLVVIDYTEKMAILALKKEEEREEILGVGRYFVDENTHTANLVLVIRDDYQHQGIGRELLSYLTQLAGKRGLLGFTAEVLVDNTPMLNLLRQFFEQQGFAVEKKLEAGIIYFKIKFRKV